MANEGVLSGKRYTAFATQHSVKGAKFENVLVILGGGRNHYNWPQLFELLHTRAVNKKISRAIIAPEIYSMYRFLGP